MAAMIFGLSQPPVEKHMNLVVETIQRLSVEQGTRRVRISNLDLMLEVGISDPHKLQQLVTEAIISASLVVLKGHGRVPNVYVVR